MKNQLEKLPLPELYLPKQRERHQIASLPLDESSVVQLAKLPPLQHDLTIATVDTAVQAYSVSILSA